MLRSCYVDAGGVIDPALRQGGFEPFPNRHRIARASRGRPRSQHLARRRRQRTDQGDAPNVGRERQGCRAVGQEHDRPSSDLARQFATLCVPGAVRPGRAAPIGVVEKAETLLQIEHAPHAGVDLGHGHETALERDRQALNVAIAGHVDIDAGLEGQSGSLDDIRRDAMVHKLRDGVVVADQNSAEAELFAQPALQHWRVGGHRHAGKINEGRHDRRRPRADGGGERGQVNLAQRSLGHIDRGIFAARGDGAIGAEVLGGGGEAVGVGKVVALKAERLGGGHLRGHPGILARALDNAAPARVARHVEHRRKGEGDAVLGRFLGGGARGFLPKIGSKEARFGQRNRKNRAMAVDDVEAQQERDAEAGFFDRKALDGMRLVGAPVIEQASDPPSSNPVIDVAELAGAGDRQESRGPYSAARPFPRSSSSRAACRCAPYFLP